MLFICRSYIVLILSLALLSACSYQHSMQATNKVIDTVDIGNRYVFDERRKLTLPIDSSVYVAIANNVKEVPFSPQLSFFLTQQLELYLPEVYAGLTALTFTEALEKAEQLSADFLLYPKVIIQEEKTSSFLETVTDFESLGAIGLDRIWIHVSVWDVNSKKFVDSTTIKGKSPLLRFSKNDTRDLFAEAMEEYTKRLIANY